MLLGLGELREILEDAPTPNEKGRIRLQKGDCVDATKQKAFWLLVKMRKLIGFTAFTDSPNFMHPVKYETPPTETRWAGVAVALLKLVNLGGRPVSKSFAKDVEFEMLGPLIWAITSASKAEDGVTDATANDDDDAMDVAA